MKKTKIDNNIRFYECSFCGQTDKKTYNEARQGKFVSICVKCEKERKNNEHF